MEIFIGVLSCIVIYFISLENYITHNGNKIIIGEVHTKVVTYVLRVGSSSFTTEEITGFTLISVKDIFEKKLKNLCSWEHCQLEDVYVSGKIYVNYTSSRFPEGYTTGVRTNFKHKTITPVELMESININMDGLYGMYDEDYSVD